MEPRFQMELRFRNEASISKRSFYFEMELRFQNPASISKSSFDFEMELRFQIKCFSRDLYYRKEARDISARFSGFYRGQSNSLTKKRKG